MTSSLLSTQSSHSLPMGYCNKMSRMATLTAMETEVFDIGYAPMKYGERAKDGSLLRPFIVWFGEAVPLLDAAAREVEQCDILIIIGTSLAVYPAAGLLYYAPSNAEIYVIDPKQPGSISRRVTYITEKATVGMKQLYERLCENK